MKFIVKFLLSAVLVLSAVVPSFGGAPPQSTMVRLHTTHGPVDFKLLDTEAPLTVANFLAYVRGGDYVDVFFHRSAWSSPTVPFVLQSGGFKWPAANNACCSVVTSRGTVNNEFSLSRSNVRGTLAMAKAATPNSATSQWFINLSDNSANLDNQNGGFTVFARVTPPSMDIADAISKLPRFAGGAPFSELPVTVLPPQGSTPTRPTLVRLLAVTEFPASQTDYDRAFNYLEAANPTYVTGKPDASGFNDGYNWRYYDATFSFVGVKEGIVYYYAPGWMTDVYPIGTLDYWFGVAQAAGY